MVAQSLIGALVLAAIHLYASKLRFLDVMPRSRWLSLAGGVAVAYTLLHLLPELQKYQHLLDERTNQTSLEIIGEHLLWLQVLAGLVIFYGLEKAARTFGRQSSGSSQALFWLHIGSYGTYNALLGYLLVEEDRGVKSLILYLIGIGLHFVVNDHSLRQHHRDRYRRIGRWILSLAIMGGWLVGVSTSLSEVVTASVTGILAGGILLNTFKEELPEERESRFWSFAFGAFGYAGILLAI